jgi:hypothetical protein
MEDPHGGGSARIGLTARQPAAARDDGPPGIATAVRQQRLKPGMIDNFGLLLSHGLMLLAAWRLLARADLNDPAALPPEPAPAKPRRRPFRKAVHGA